RGRGGGHAILFRKLLLAAERSVSILSRNTHAVLAAKDECGSSGGPLRECRAGRGLTVGQVEDLLTDQVAEIAERELDQPAAAKQHLEPALFPAIKVQFFIEPGDHTVTLTARECGGVDRRFAVEGEGQNHQVLTRPLPLED